jgi:signal transduction histidine kinase
MAGVGTDALGPRRAVAFAASAGLAVTLVSLLPVTSVAYRSHTLHVAIETAVTLIALLAGLLVLGRFRRAPALRDAVIAGGLLMLALTNLCFSVVPWIADQQPGSFDTWTPIAGRLIGAAGLAVGAWLPATPVRRPRTAVVRTIVVIAVALAAIALLGALLAPELPVGVDADLAPDASGVDLTGQPALLVAQVIGVLLYALSATGFARRAMRTGDELMTWFAAASTLAAFSRLNYFLFPSLYSEWVYAGDFLRVAFYALVLLGALREIAAYQRELAGVAVDRERRRMARDLHDGLAQDLAFIHVQARRLEGGPDAPAARIAAAAERALQESRHALATLARPADAALGASVAQAAEEVTSRDGVRLHLDLASGLRAPEPVHDGLVRIVREAVSNAIRHGAAKSVTVRLSGTRGLELTVDDDGAGLGENALDGRGFGLVSMRERAEALGGSIEIAPRPQRGVRVMVRLP